MELVKNTAMVKFLIIGGSGVIGFKLVKFLIRNNENVEFTYLTNKVPFANGYCLDITKREETIKLITKVNPDIVIHSSAITSVDLCETNRQLANSVNVNGTVNVIEGCKKSNSKIVYISTSFVFDGKKQEYFEEDLTSPSTYYGITKFKGEELVRKSDLPYLILRTDQPYCWTEKWQHTNSVLRVLQTLRSGKVLQEILDWYNTPTYVPDFVLAADKLLNRNKTGTFHVVGSDFINRYEWSLIVTDIFRLNKNIIKPITSDSLKLPVKRPNVNLSNQKLFQKVGIRMRGVKEGLMKMLEDGRHFYVLKT